MLKLKRTIAVVTLMLLSMGFIHSHGWYKLKKKEFGFKIEFPEEPAPKTQNVNSKMGFIKMNMFVYDASKKKDENLAYLVNYTVYPDSLIHSYGKGMEESLYKSSIQGSVENVHGKLLSEKTVGLKEYTGREVKIDFKDGMAVITMRLFLVKNKMYILEVITATGNDFNMSTKHFMDSFELL